MAKVTLPKLPYGYDSLAPYISEQIMTIHHSGHHQAYVNNFNAALQAQTSIESSQSVPDQYPVSSAIRFNAGGHINHTLFWENLTPAISASDVAKTTRLYEALRKRWGSLEEFKSQFEATLLGIQGSGWGWLVQDVDRGSLEIVVTKDQDVVPKGKKPLLGVDMWEHAYYLQYLNNKKEYVKGIWNVVDWAVVDRRLAASTVNDVYGKLVGLVAKM